MTLTLGFVGAPVVVPMTLPVPGDVRASAESAQTGGSTNPDVGTPAHAADGHDPVSTAFPPPMPATPLMVNSPPLPDDPTRSGRVLLFTFDDGPDPRWTPQVLALLRSYRAHAVFCVVGDQARRHPELVRAIVGAGHDLCNHSMHHDEDLALRPGLAVRRDLTATQEIVRGTTGGPVPLYVRAPGGRWSPTLIGEGQVLGLTPLDWSVDPRDWSRPGLRHIVDTVLREAAPGGVVVLHDGGGERSQSVLALGFLLRRLRQLGYSFR